jgi:hypothetical protein
MDLQEVGLECFEWMNLAQDRDRWRSVVNAVMSLRVPQNAGNFLNKRGTVIFTRNLPCGLNWLYFELIFFFG